MKLEINILFSIQFKEINFSSGDLQLIKKDKKVVYISCFKVVSKVFIYKWNNVMQI